MTTRFVIFSLANGGRVAINPDQVIAVLPQGETQSEIDTLDTAKNWFVLGTLEDVVHDLREPPP